MALQKVTRTSYGQRMKKSASNVGTGFILVIAATILLFWNEGRTAKTASMLKRAQKECVELNDINTVNSDFDGKLVHASGATATSDILTDEFFKIQLNAIRLSRKVEYYQWVEHSKTETKDNVGGSQTEVTTYWYEKEWCYSPVNSSNFEYSRDEAGNDLTNSVLVPNLEDDYQLAENVSFGAYSLPSSLISQMGESKNLNLEEHPINPAILNSLDTRIRAIRKGGSSVKYTHVSGNLVYLGADSADPQIGDMKVTFTFIVPHDVSILAKVNGNTFEQHTDAKNGKTLLTLTDGTVSMEEMFATEKANNKALAWILRILGIIMLYIGFKNIFDFITNLLKVLPFLANIASLGTGLVAGALALVWGFVIIALAWLWYRPLLGILMLALAGVLIWFLGKRSKEKAAAAPAPAAAPAAPAEPTEPTNPQA